MFSIVVKYISKKCEINFLHIFGGDYYRSMYILNETDLHVNILYLIYNNLI